MIVEKGAIKGTDLKQLIIGAGRVLGSAVFFELKSLSRWSGKKLDNALVRAMTQDCKQQDGTSICFSPEPRLASHLSLHLPCSRCPEGEASGISGPGSGRVAGRVLWELEKLSAQMLPTSNVHEMQ